jgi:Tfp pilus assembly protein PilW
VSLLHSILRRIGSEESGVSLIELLVAISVGVVVVFAAFQFSDTAGKSQANTSARTEALQQAQNGLERMTRDLRQAATVAVPTSESVEMSTYVKSPSGGGTLQAIRYVCASGACQRFVGTAATGETVVSAVRNVDVFDPEPALEPRFVGIKLRVSVTGATQGITLRDGVEIRNRVR